MIELHRKIAEACPTLIGVSIGDPNDKATWRLSFPDGTPPEVISRAGEIVSAFDPNAPTSGDVAAERDRRMATISFNGRVYDFDAASQQNIAAACTLAVAAIGAGAQPGDLRWASPTYDFSWIAFDNTLVPMDAPTMLAFGTAAAQYKSALIYKARALKDTSPIPQDYINDRHWS